MLVTCLLSYHTASKDDQLSCHISSKDDLLSCHIASKDVMLSCHTALKYVLLSCHTASKDAHHGPNKANYFRTSNARLLLCWRSKAFDRVGTSLTI